MFTLMTLLLIVGVFICIQNEYHGFYVCILVGFLQDIYRKMVPGEPVYLTLLIGIYVAFILVGIFLRRGALNFDAVLARVQPIKGPLMLFFLLVVVQCVHAYSITGSLVIPAIGMIAYLGPFTTLYLGYILCRDPDRVLKYTQFYSWIALAMCLSVIASYFGIDMKLFEAVGVGLHTWNPYGGVLELHNGFFRGSEMAGWHGAAAVCFLIIASIYEIRRGHVSFYSSVMIPVLVFAVFVTGRRKFLVEILIFIIVYGVLLAWFRGRANRLVKILLASLLVGGILMSVFMSERFERSLDAYYQRTLAVQDEAKGRVEGNAIYGLKWVYRTNGFFGSGAGVGSQGAQHFGGGSKIVGLAAEGGLGKVLAELGVPGLMMLAIIGYSLVLMIYRRCIYLGRNLPLLNNMTSGLLAFLIANAAVFATAHQIFGDVYVLLLLGWVTGALIAVSDIEMQKQRITMKP